MVAFAVATLVAGTLTSFSDWYFMGVLFHGRYNRHPEIWRDGIREGKERGAIIVSSAFGYIAAASVFGLCMQFGVRDFYHAVLLSLLVWGAGPLGVVAANGLFVKFDALVSVAHGLGYLARSVIAALTSVIALSFT